MGDRQTFQIMPSAATGTPDTGRAARALPFRHENETARPHYYGVRFENGLKAEMTPTDHAAVLRFTYPGDDASVLFDNVTDQAGLTLDPAAGTVTGYSDVKSGLSTGATRLFVYGVFDKPVTDGAASGVKGYLRFDAGADRTVTLRLATSLISVDQAKDNLRQEIPARPSRPTAGGTPSPPRRTAGASPTCTAADRASRRNSTSTSPPRRPPHRSSSARTAGSSTR
ncbi:hypothetical protein SGLAM104S_07899 [Streptomyces glaucescens]